MLGAPGGADRPAWARPGLMIAAGVIVLIVIGGVVVMLAPGDSSHDPQAPAPRPPAPAAPSAAAPDGAVLPTALPTVAPSDVTWQLVGQAAVPVSASAGPSTVTGGTATGYARTPIGALIAAAQISTRAGLAAGEDSWRPTIEQQMVAGPDRDRLLAALEAAGDSSTQPGELSQIAGYQYLSYSPDTAVIGLVYRAPSAGSPRYHVLTLTLVWRDGDWRLMPPPGGAWTAVNRPAPDLTGVIEWGAR